MNYHIISDLHLEFNTNINNLDDLERVNKKLYSDIPNRDTSDTILLLAGDIGNPYMDNYWNFLTDCSYKYKYVIFIAGNHEYYNLNKSTKNTIKQIELFIKSKLLELNLSNLYYLDNTHCELDDVIYYGSTLWTHIDDKNKLQIQYSISDYENIYIDTNKLITCDDTNMIHNFQVEQLKEFINNHNESKKLVILTHHLPTQYLSHHKYKIYGFLYQAFYTDLTHIFSDKISLWVAGHTHTPMKYIYNNTLFITNPFGYPNENKCNKIKKIERF